MSDWTFFSNHAHVLFLVSVHQKITARELAVEIGITERFVLKIIQDLCAGGYISVDKEGRNNCYSVKESKQLRHPIEAHVNVGQLIELINPT